MTAPLPHNDTMAIAKESIAMSKQTGDKTFQIMAMVMMAAGGLATLLHAGHVIYRDMMAGRVRNPQRAGEPAERPIGQPPQEPIEHARSEHGPSWVHKARVGERTDSPKAWTEHAARHGHARQH